MRHTLRFGAAVAAAILALVGTVYTQNDQKTNSTITANGQSVCLTFAGGGSGTAQLSGTWTGTITWKAATRAAVTPTPYRATNTGDGATGTTTTSNGLFAFGAAGLERFCAEATATITGTVTVDIRVSQGTGLSAAAGAGGGGDATAANQATGNASLASIDTKTPALVSGRQPVDPSGVTSPVSLASVPLATGAATGAKQDTGNASLASIDGKIPASPATDRTTAAAPNAVRLTDGSSFYKATTPSDTQPVSGTFWQATQPVSATQLPAALAANGGMKVEGVAGGVAVPVSGTFWQATQPVSGTVTGNQGTANTAANRWPVYLTDGTNTFPMADAVGRALFGKVTDGTNVMAVNASGQASVNCANCSGSGVSHADNAGFTPGTTNFVPVGGEVDDTGTSAASENSAAAARITPQRGLHVNLRNLAGTEVGTAADPIRTDPTGSTTQPVSGTVTANLAAGTNNIGDVDVLTLPALPAGTNNIGDVDVLTLPAITGTVTANAGTNLNTSALALSATQTDRTQKTQVTDGTRDGTIKAGSTAAAAGDTSLVVGLSPNSPLPAGTNVLGEVTQAQKIVDDVTPVTWDSTTNGGVAVPVTAADGAAGTLNLNTLGAGCATLWMLPNGTDISAGNVAFDVLPRIGGTWVELSGSNGDKTFVDSDLSPHSSAYNGKYAGWRFPVQTFRKLRIRLQTPISGTSTISVWGTSVSEGCAPFGVVRQGDPTRLNASVQNYTGTLGGATWTSATAADTRATVTVLNLTSVNVTIRPTGTITGGIIVTEISDASSPGASDWFAMPGGAQIGLAGMTTATQQSFTVSVSAGTSLSVRLVSQITGSSSPGVTIVMVPSSGAPVRTSTINYKNGFTLTTAALGVSGVYTSPWFDNSSDGNMASVCYARSNVASAASGFVVQQSGDPTDSNFTISSYSATVNASTTTAAFANTYQRYWRIVYTNGGTGQTTFKIVCSLNPVQFVLTDNLGISYNNPTLFTAYDAGVSSATTQRVVQAQELTYAASTTAKTATAAGTAAFAELCGSGTKTIRVQRITVSGTVATAAIYGDLTVRKNSSAGTGGTATTLTGVPYDSNSAAATATAKFFTVLPTGGGALVGTLYSQTGFYPLTGTVASMTPQLERTWRDTDSEAPTLRGTGQCIAVGFGTTPTNAPTLTVSFTWTEK